MTLESALRYVGRHPDNIFVIADPQTADRLVKLLRENRVWDYVREISAKHKKPKKVEDAVYGALGPAEAHGSGMGQRYTVAIVLRDLDGLSIGQIDSIQTGFFEGGTDFSSTVRTASKVFYVAQSMRDVERFREPYIFKPDSSILISKYRVVPLYTTKQLARAYLMVASNPKYFTFTDPPSDVPPKALDAFLKVKQQYATQIGMEKLHSFESLFYDMLEQSLTNVTYFDAFIDRLPTILTRVLKNYRSALKPKWPSPYETSYTFADYNSWKITLELLLQVLLIQQPRNERIFGIIEEQYARLREFRVD